MTEVKVGQGTPHGRPRKGFRKAYYWWEWKGKTWPRLTSPGAAVISGTGERVLGDFQTGEVYRIENPASAIPLKWTAARVRVNAKGQVQVALGRKRPKVGIRSRREAKHAARR
jgi:hypothetical protein